MGRGGKAENGTRKLGVFSVEEVTSHNKADDKWLIINGNIYDITIWAKKHPGGAKVISHYAGEDATVSFVMHEPFRCHTFINTLCNMDRDIFP